ncbi:flagellar biosynthesis protein FlhB [soil metagenome]
MVGGSILFMVMAGGSMLEGSQAVFRAGLTFDRAAAFAPQDMAPRLGTTMVSAFQVFGPLMALAAVGAILGMLAIGGWNFTTKAFEIKPERMSPLAGIKRMFSLNTLGEIGKSSLAVLLIGAVAFWFIRAHLANWAGLAAYETHAGIGVAMTDIGKLLTWLIGPMIVVAGADAALSWWRHHKGLRMTKEEQRLEAREAEGNPEIKQRVRQQQREMARRRMMAAVPQADVVITNPTHYAVALRYAEGSMRAPIVVAKGVDLTAARIREIAAEHKVMLVEAPPLARALFRNAEIDAEIPGPLYSAVAQVLAYVFQIRAGLRNVELGQIEVAPELDIPAAQRA